MNNTTLKKMNVDESLMDLDEIKRINERLEKINPVFVDYDIDDFNRFVAKKRKENVPDIESFEEYFLQFHRKH